jgi:general secretion pathway protein B
MLAEVPESARRGLPALNVTGAVYSENPAQRLLLVNGLVLPQGATAAPEVVIEEIRARSATFNFRGTRFRVGF